MNVLAADGVVMTGFVLKNASWNKAKGCIEELKEFGNRIIPSVLLRPAESDQNTSDKNNNKNEPYKFDCPVYLNDVLPSRFEPIISLPFIPLPSSLPAYVCRQRQVCLTG